MQLSLIQEKIYEVRSQKVMLDFDLAELYEVETRVLNQAIKRNADSFPTDFMFRLTAKEWQKLSSTQVVIMEGGIEKSSSQFVMSSRKYRGKRYTPYAFTEHGVTMLASILKSRKARKMNIAIVRAFVALKRFILQHNNILEQLEELRDRIGNHDAQLNHIYNAIETLLDEKTEHKKWEERERIGFSK